MSLSLLFNGQREALFPEGEAFLRKRGVITPLYTFPQDVTLKEAQGKFTFVGGHEIFHLFHESSQSSHSVIHKAPLYATKAISIRSSLILSVSV
jgi:hypothetical protein